MIDCKHWEGDFVNGYWLCANCFAKLPDRPQKYGSEKLELPKVYDGDKVWSKDVPRHPTRQTVILAPIAEAQGYTLYKFVEAMAFRLMARTNGSFQKNDALDYVVDILKTLGEPFGAKDFDWTSAGAWELVDDDMQYWDDDSRSSN